VRLGVAGIRVFAQQNKHSKTLNNNFPSKKNKEKGARGQEVDWGRGCKKRGQQPEIERGLMQEAETNIIILTCCPGCKVNAKSSPHPLSRASNMESDAANRGRVKGERGQKERKG